jgi:uncharacterized protein YkwD
MAAFLNFTISKRSWRLDRMKLISTFLILYALFLIAAPASAQEDNIKNTILEEVNKLRASGCLCGDKEMPPVPALTWNDKLETAAVKHVKDMFENQNFNHVGTDGSILSERIEATGYKWSMIGENISYGYSNAADVVQGWKESEGHCHNIMNEVFTEMGAANKGIYWVLDLSAPKAK